MIEQLNNSELGEIFFKDVKSPRVKNLMEGFNSYDEKLNFIEHSILLYWKNKIISNENINESEIVQLLDYKGYNIYQNVIGELSKNNLLKSKQLKMLMAHMNVNDWGYLQSDLRLRIMDMSNSTRNVNRVDKELLDLVFKNKVSWALEEILEYFQINELQSLYDEIMKRKYFTKTERHYLLQKIKLLIKSKNKTVQ